MQSGISRLMRCSGRRKYRRRLRPY
ncbi:MAG: hypothetical protein E3J72_02205 [Planctomycetota bacterium]|nr:MAG: hypothetical protein E3J72_02205 [Planctomycetota bacterium]